MSTPFGGVMPHFLYSSGSVSAVTKPRTASFASWRPPTWLNEVSGLTLTSTRPVRSPNFSPSLAKTSSMRRWMAHCWLSGSSFGGTAPGPPLASSGAIRLDPLSRQRGRREQPLRLVEHALLGEDGRLRADGQRDGVGGAR